MMMMLLPGVVAVGEMAVMLGVADCANVKVHPTPVGSRHTLRTPLSATVTPAVSAKPAGLYPLSPAASMVQLMVVGVTLAGWQLTVREEGSVSVMVWRSARAARKPKPCGQRRGRTGGEMVGQEG